MDFNLFFKILNMLSILDIILSIIGMVTSNVVVVLF